MGGQKNIFVCFATNDMERAKDQIVADALALGIFYKIEVWGEADIHRQPEYATLPESLKRGRGFGFFWWKPFIIRKAIEGADEGDLVFYSDCGRYDGGFRLGCGLVYLIERYRLTGFTGVEVPQFGPALRWTRRECFGVLECDPGLVGRLPQIQATFSLWRKGADTMMALKEWERCCRIPQLVADPVGVELTEQLDSFVAHRHDQSILTLITRKYNMKYINLCGSISGWILPYLSRAGVVNVEMKKTEFVADILNARKFLLGAFLLKYLRAKCNSWW